SRRPPSTPRGTPSSARARVRSRARPRDGTLERTESTASAYRRERPSKERAMRRAHIVVGLGLAVAALALAGCGGGSGQASSTTTEATTTETTTMATGNTLTASVGPGFEISLKDSSGNDVETLTAGAYTINVDDQSDIHNFHLTGTGVDEMTDVSGTGM